MDNIETISLPEFKIQERIGAKRVPLTVSLELTERCNYDCIHCYINRPANDVKRQKKEMDFGTIKGIIDAATQEGCLFCLVTGGEPLLRKDFPEIYRYLKKKGLLVTVFTNAALIDQKIGRLFKMFPPHEVEITVYGATQKVYESITRRKGSFKKFQRGIDILERNRVPFRFKTIALKKNINEIEAIRSFCLSRAPSEIFRFDPVLQLTYRGNRQKNTLIKSNRLSAKEIVRLDLQDFNRSKVITKWCSESSVKPAGHCGHLISCTAGESSFAVDAYANFKLCLSLVHPDCMLDLRKNTFTYAWNVFTPQVKSTKIRDRKSMEECFHCEYAGFCSNCVALSYLEYATMEKPIPWLCELTKARAAVFSKRAL